MNEVGWRRFWLLTACLTAFGVFLRLYDLGAQPPLLDEVQTVFSARNYMEGGQFGPTMAYHPNLRNILIYWMGQSQGYGPYSLRGISLMTGILSIPLTGMLLYALTRNKTASFLSSFLLSLEQVHITFSRQAIQETWTTFFFLLGTLLAVLSFKKDRPSLLLFSGIVFGLGISSKFHAFFPLMACLLAGVYLSWRGRDVSRGVFIFCCLVLLPLMIFLLTYLPWFHRGYSIGDWIGMQQALLIKMTSHKGNPMDQTIDIAAWQWFLRPMGYANFVLSQNTPFVTIAFSNPPVWLLVLPSSVYLISRYGMSSRGKTDAFHRPGSCCASDNRLGSTDQPRQGIFFVILLFIISYLPLAISTRPIWLLSSLAVLPFAFMIVALAATELAEKVRWGRSALAVYIIAVMLISLALYPMAIGRGKQFDYLNAIIERFRPPFEAGPF